MTDSPISRFTAWRDHAWLGGMALAAIVLTGGHAVAQEVSAGQVTGQSTGEVTGEVTSEVTGQVDLLVPMQDDGGDETLTTGSPIDELLKTIPLDDAGSDSVDTVTSAAADNATITPPVAAAAPTPIDNATVPAAGPMPTATLSTSASAGEASLEKAAPPRFGVADIGIDPVVGSDDGLTSTMWRGTSLAQVNMLLDTKAIIGSSPALSRLASDVVARRAVRPDGAEESDVALLNRRLDWLAAAGRSEELAVIINQLPNDEPWLEWKQWLVETQLMSGDDGDACRNVMYQVTRTLDPFWHKMKVICTAAHKGDITGAQFAADILLAMGVDDPVFSSLVGKLLNGVEPGPFDPALVEQLHIMLMEITRHEIDVEGLAALPDSSIQTAVGLHYLDPGARLVVTWRALHHGLIDHEQAAKRWRYVPMQPDTPRLALARHQSQPTALTRALLWRALDAEKSADRLPFVAAAMDVDVADGVGGTMAPLYAGLAREALDYEDAEVWLAKDDGALRTKLAMLVSVGDTDEIPAILAGDEASAARDLLAMAESAPIDMASLATLGKFPLLPLVDAGVGPSGVPSVDTGTDLGTEMTATAPAAAMSLLVAGTPGTMAPERFLSVSPVMLRALDEAASGGRVAETILLAHRTVGANSLVEMNPADMARIAKALALVEQGAPAQRFRREVVAAHLMAIASTRQIELPAVASVMPAQTQVVDKAAPVSDSETVTDSDASAGANVAGGGAIGGDEQGDNGSDDLVPTSVAPSVSPSAGMAPQVDEEE